MDAAKELLTQADAPTAIFASNDDMAAGVLMAAHELGINVPATLVGGGIRRHLHREDRVAAADDGASAHLRPRLHRDQPALCKCYKPARPHNRCGWGIVWSAAPRRPSFTNDRMTRTAASPARARILLLMLAVTLGVSACTNFFYNRLDTLAAWYIQDLVSLDESQRSDLRSWLESTLQWHRSSELARYSKFLRELSSTAAHPGNASTYKGIEAQVERFGARLVDQAAPDAARLLMSLSSRATHRVRNQPRRKIPRAQRGKSQSARRTASGTRSAPRTSRNN